MTKNQHLGAIQNILGGINHDKRIIIGIVGDVVGVISKWIFTHANRMIQYLWADLRNGGNPDTTFDNHVDADNDTTQN